LPVGHPSSNRSRPSTLNPEFFSDELPEKKVYLVDMSILSILLSPGQDVTLTENRKYSAKSAYAKQFIGAAVSFLYKTVWRAWAPHELNLFLGLPSKIRFGWWTV
jgi:hypothetical protein